MKQIEVEKDILDSNKIVANENRELFSRKGIFVMNLMSSPGAGKTTLLERTIELLKDKYSLGIIEGDIATTYDAERIGAHGIPVKQINTAGACHLEGKMIKDALTDFDLDHLDLIIIENVGNLVCPAEFDLGEDAKAMVLSITEGEDKPLKYPLMFRLSRALIINKVDLLPYTNCNVGKIIEDVNNLNPDMEIFEISCTKKTGLEKWIAWLEKEIENKKKCS